MQGVKKIWLSVGLIAFSGIAFAQSTSLQDVSVHEPAAPHYPSGTPQPVVDNAGLTYLPWLGRNVQKLVNYANFFYQLEVGTTQSGSGAYNATITALVNSRLTEATQTALTNSTNLTLANLQNVLTFGSDNIVTATTTYSAIPGTDTQPNGSLNNFTFNADNLLGVVANDSNQYSPSDKQTNPINELILFLSGSANPLGGLDFSKDDKERKKQLAGTNVQSYLLSSRVAAAGQSVAFSNLNYLAQERMTVAGLGKKAGMSTLPTDGTEQTINDASQLQLEQFLVNRRVGNSKWYTTMNTSSSITVQRETLFVLAEIQRQLYEQKLLMERMLAEQVAMQAQTAQLNKTKLDYDRSQVQQSLSSNS